MIKGDEVVNGLRQKGVTLFREDEVIGNTDRYSLWQNDGVHQERVQRAQATNVKVEVDTSVMVQNEVTNRVGTLDHIFVVVEGIKKPRILLSDELARVGIRPQHVLAEAGVCVRQGACTKHARDVLVRHHVATGFGNVFPLWRKRFRLPSLMEDTGNALDHSVLGCIPAGRVVEDGDVEVGEICCGIDSEVVGDGREDEEGAEEEEGEEDEGDVESASLCHELMV